MRAACIHAHSAGGIFCALAQLHEALHADRQIFAPMADDMQCSAQRLVERQHGHRALVGVPLAEHFWKYRNAQPLRNGLMMLPNLVGVVGLSGVVVRETQAYLKRK